MQFLFKTGAAFALASLLSGCAVVMVTATAASLVVDAAVGAVKITGKAVGAAADVVLPSGGDAQH